MTLMTFKIPDIACIGHLFNLLMYYVRGFACAWMALRARNLSSSGLATFNPQSTVHGPRPGPKLACGVRASSLRATKPRSRGKTRGPKRKKCLRAEKHMYIYINVFFWPFGTFFSSGRGSLLVLSAPWHAGSPPGPHTQVWALAEVRARAPGVQSGKSPRGGGFRARRAIQAHANPST